ncbi:MAG: molecular chaperone DnaJ, partial [Halobacteriaceae archaeon]
MAEDFYDVLGVSRDADEDEIQRAFREKAAKYHPDVSDEADAEDKFKKIKKAKEVLTDEEQRQLYDQLGHERYMQAEKRGATEGGAGQGGARGGAGGMGGNPFGGGGMGDGPFGGGMGDIFDQFFGGSGRQGPRQGRDLRTELEIDLEEAYHGVTREMTVTRPQRCPTCDGAGHPPDADVRTCPECNGQGQITRTQQTPLGRVQQTQTCQRCGGEGEITSESCSRCGGDGVVREQSTLSVDIPAGIRDGQTLRMKGEGAPGERGAPNGNLKIDISIKDHPEFDREGDDLIRRQPISFPQAVFGATIEVPTIDGSTEIDIPSGTQSGETFTVRREGMPRAQRRGRGDLHVRIQVVVPEDLNEKQREALEQFAEAGGEEVEVSAGFFERLR